MKFFLPLLLIFLSGCFSPPKTWEGKISGNLTEKVIIGPELTKQQKEFAFNSSMFINSLAGTSFNPKFDRFYWGTNMVYTYGITMMQLPRNKQFTLINHEIYPKTNTVDEIFLFGLVTLHEHLHLYHRLKEREVEILLDIPAEEGYIQFKKDLDLKFKELKINNY